MLQPDYRNPAGTVILPTSNYNDLCLKLIYSKKHVITMKDQEYMWYMIGNSRSINYRTLFFIGKDVHVLVSLDIVEESE